MRDHICTNIPWDHGDEEWDSISVQSKFLRECHRIRRKNSDSWLEFEENYLFEPFLPLKVQCKGAILVVKNFLPMKLKLIPCRARNNSTQHDDVSYLHCKDCVMLRINRHLVFWSATQCWFYTQRQPANQLFAIISCENMRISHGKVNKSIIMNESSLKGLN